jgi:hypothetical protein
LRAGDGLVATALGEPVAARPDTLGARPFADPLLWAPFMLIGRA